MCCGRKSGGRQTGKRSGLIVHKPQEIKYFGKVTPEGKLDSVQGQFFLATKDLQRLIGCEVVFDGKLKDNVLFVDKWIVTKEKESVQQISPPNVAQSASTNSVNES